MRCLKRTWAPWSFYYYRGSNLVNIPEILLGLLAGSFMLRLRYEVELVIAIFIFSSFLQLHFLLSKIPMAQIEMVQFMLSQFTSIILQTLRSCWSLWFVTNDFIMLQVKAIAHTCLIPHTFYFIVMCTSINLCIHVRFRLAYKRKHDTCLSELGLFLFNISNFQCYLFFINGINPSFFCDGHWGWLYLGYCVQYSVRHEYAGVLWCSDLDSLMNIYTGVV